MDESNGNGKGQIYEFSDRHSNDRVVINFLTSGQLAATFSWQDKRTLSQIEQMTGYKVKPRGVVSQFKHGGFVVYEKDGHGLVAAITGLGKLDWNDAKTACDELVLNGYSDWHLPNYDELVYIDKLIKKGIILNQDYYGYYWSSSEDNSTQLFEDQQSQMETEGQLKDINSLKASKNLSKKDKEYLRNLETQLTLKLKPSIGTLAAFKYSFRNSYLIATGDSKEKVQYPWDQKESIGKLAICNVHAVRVF